MTHRPAPACWDISGHGVNPVPSPQQPPAAAVTQAAIRAQQDSGTRLRLWEGTRAEQVPAPRGGQAGTQLPGQRVQPCFTCGKPELWLASAEWGERSMCELAAGFGLC